jgi:hypothetical protein
MNSGSPAVRILLAKMNPALKQGRPERDATDLNTMEDALA